MWVYQAFTVGAEVLLTYASIIHADTCVTLFSAISLDVALNMILQGHNLEKKTISVLFFTYHGNIPC